MDMKTRYEEKREIKKHFIVAFLCLIVFVWFTNFKGISAVNTTETVKVRKIHNYTVKIDETGKVRIEEK